MTYTYTDHDGAGLRIERSNQPDEAFLQSERGAFVPAADLPAIVAELYKAAGQEPPIILPRRNPEADWVRDGKVRPLLKPYSADMEPAEARDMAAWYASAADLAEAERDREDEQVEELAGLIRESDLWIPADSTASAARVVIRLGYTRSES